MSARSRRQVDLVDQAAADRIIDRLAGLGNQLRMPHSRALGEGLYELRFSCEGVARRITYVFERERSVITLTTFHKQRQNERAEILRARRAQAGRVSEVSDRRSTSRSKKRRRMER